jgi:hypothetical protein
MKKINLEIKWAVIFMAVLLLWMVLEKLTGLHGTHIDKHLYLTNLFAIPAVWIYVLALKEKRKSLGGKMTFLQGFISGMFITTIVTIFSPVNQWIISEIITPEYFPNVIEYSIKTGYHKSREEAEAFFNLENYIMQSVVGALVMGSISSLIVAFFVKKG